MILTKHPIARSADGRMGNRTPGKAPGGLPLSLQCSPQSRAMLTLYLPGMRCYQNPPRKRLERQNTQVLGKNVSGAARLLDPKGDELPPGLEWNHNRPTKNTGWKRDSLRTFPGNGDQLTIH